MTINNLPSDSPEQKALLDQTRDRLPELRVGTYYPIQKIMGDAFWDNLKQCPRATGRRFSKLVAMGRVPFTFDDLTRNRHNSYLYTG